MPSQCLPRAFSSTSPKTRSSRWAWPRVSSRCLANAALSPSCDAARTIVGSALINCFSAS